MKIKKTREKRVNVASYLSLILLLTLLLSSCSSGKNLEDNLDKEIKVTGEYLIDSIEEPKVSSIGGDWIITGISKGEVSVEKEYLDIYYDNVKVLIKSNKGKISESYPTDYARVIISLCSIKKDPQNVEGYNLVKPLDDYNFVEKQGRNAVAYALIASNVANVKLKNENRYINYLIEGLKNEKYYLNDKMSDYTSMVLQGLSFYKEKKEVKDIMEKAIEGLSSSQKKDGTYGNCESTVEAIIAVTSLGIDPFKDERFIKEGNSLGEGLMAFRESDSFVHIKNAKGFNNQMSTEHGLLALCSMKSFKENGKGIFQ